MDNRASATSVQGLGNCTAEALEVAEKRDEKGKQGDQPVGSTSFFGCFAFL